PDARSTCRSSAGPPTSRSFARSTSRFSGSARIARRSCSCNWGQTAMPTIGSVISSCRTTRTSPSPSAPMRSHTMCAVARSCCSAAAGTFRRRSLGFGRRHSGRSEVSVCSAEMADLTERVAAKIAEMDRYLDRTGGHVELVDVQDGIARVRLVLTRPRANRLVASLQVKGGIERALKADIPELRGVEAANLPPYTFLGWDEPDFIP